MFTLHNRRRRLMFIVDPGEAGGGAPDDQSSLDGQDQSDAVDLDDDAGEDEDPPGADALGDAGKKALDTMKRERNEARRLLREAQAESAAAKAKADGREAEHQAEQDAQKVRDDALAAANKRVLRSDVKAAATGKLADPTDAFNYLDLDDFEADDNGDFDSGAIASAIDDLIARKPYLAAQGGRRFEGSADGGARNGSGPKQFTSQDQLAGMTPAEISTALAQGKLDRLLGRK